MSAPAITAVVKVGGSLDGECGDLRALCRALAALARRHRLLIVPGGGRFADAVRAAGARYALDDEAAHWMAILGMDQYGYLLASLTAGAVAVRDVAEARRVAARGLAAILLPFDLMRRRDPLPHSWDVTSDSIAAWLCAEAAAERLVLLKDVDGIFAADPRHAPAARLLSAVAAADLSSLGGVDTYLPRLLPALQMEVWVLNGTVPGRLAALLDCARLASEYPGVAGTRLCPHTPAGG